MATSSIFKNFVVEGKDVEDFANSLDNAFTEKEKRGNYVKKGIVITDKDKIKDELEGAFNFV